MKFQMEMKNMLLKTAEKIILLKSGKELNKILFRYCAESRICKL